MAAEFFWFEINGTQHGKNRIGKFKKRNGKI